MALNSATSPLDPSAGVAKEFHLFPQLPPELRVRIWQIAYSAIPYTCIYRFRLEFGIVSDHRVSSDEEFAGRQAFLVPLKEVGYLTRELRSLQKVNTESRYERGRYFDSYLRLNQTAKGHLADSYPPINIPWKRDQNFFCFVGLEDSDLLWLREEHTVWIAQVFSTVVSLGIGVDRALEDGLTNAEFFEHGDFARLILRFPKIEEVVLVSDLLMTETDLDNIDDDVRSRFMLESWTDWVGKVPEDIISPRCIDAKIVSKEDHLRILEDFATSMEDYGYHDSEEAAKLLCSVTYGMMFRTEWDLRYLLWDDEMLDDDSSNDEFSDDSNDEPNEEVGGGDGDGDGDGYA